jgi:hypothetical protein
MALSKRGFYGRVPTEGHSSDECDDKHHRKVAENERTSRRRRLGCVALSVLTMALYSYHFTVKDTVTLTGKTGVSRSSSRPTSSTDDSPDIMYPFLSSSRNDKVPFPIIPELENCTVTFKPPSSRTEESEWRKPFWIPSFPSSGASNPTNKGDLSKDLIGKLTGLTNKPVKNYHMSMRKRLKRCHGVSETVACTQGHPIVPINPETQTENFQPKAIVFVRNFATAFPASLTDKNIAYHNADKQHTVSQYETIRDEWFQQTFGSWSSLLNWWRTSKAYDVALYVPFEDLMTIQRNTARSVLQQLGMVLQEGGLEVASADEDLDCIWYTTIKEEWSRQQSIMDYIPTYTPTQQEWMVSQMQQLIQNVSQPSHKESSSDASLVGILERYLDEMKLLLSARL